MPKTVTPMDFYPRSPCGERHTQQRHLPEHPQFLSTLSLRRATRGPPEGQTGQGISIHALLAESDLEKSLNEELDNGISIHALLAESDLSGEKHKTHGMKFLSTLSLRRATLIMQIIHSGLHSNFYPRSPCGERRSPGTPRGPCHHISIHALLAESDILLLIVRERARVISIHALLAESDKHACIPCYS